MKKFIKISIPIILVAASILCLSFIIYNINNKDKNIEFISIKSEADLKEVLNIKKNNEVLKDILTLPLSIFSLNNYRYINNGFGGVQVTDDMATPSGPKVVEQGTSSDYSTTNIQAENVDEADVVKTDGEYIYSISENSVVISKTDKTGKVEIISKLTSSNIPQDILINNNKLVVISYVSSNSNSSSGSSTPRDIMPTIYPPYYQDSSSTAIEIYDIKDKTKAKLIKKIDLDKKYYTSRMIDDKVYVLTTGSIQNNNTDDDIVPYYVIDGKVSKLAYNNIKYIKDNKTSSISIVATVNLADLDKGVDISGYLMPIDNVYVSENNIYLAFEKYEQKKYSYSTILKLFTLRGIPGFLYDMSNYYDSYTSYSKKYTTIVKFKFTDKGIDYVANAKELGNTLNQFSMDEYKGNLRVTLSENTNKSKLLIYSSEMKKIGQLDNIAPGEKIYSTRFIKDRAYLVTYKTIDPLFVIDLSNVNQPKILGELKIPGYSTYIHPYDENHIIGIGNETKEIITRDDFGKVISQRAYITGMKMAIFDVTDVTSPKEKFVQVMGDSYTYSTVLKNHKALLFSKEKELIAIPVNNYNKNIDILASEDISSNINSMDKISQKPIGNGYIVYNINLKDGFKQKGIITHDTSDKSGQYWYNQNNSVRGLYIDNILYTISEKYIKSHSLDKLEQKSNVEIGG